MIVRADEPGAASLIAANGIHDPGVPSGFSKDQAVLHEVAGYLVLSINPVLPDSTRRTPILTLDPPAPMPWFDVLLHGVFAIEDRGQGLNSSLAYRYLQPIGLNLARGATPTGDPMEGAVIYHGLNAGGIPLGAFGLHPLIMARTEPLTFFGLGIAMLSVSLMVRQRISRKRPHRRRRHPRATNLI